MITLSQFQEILQNKGLPYSKKTILKYERLGVIPFPKNPLQNNTRIDRVYSQEEVEQNIERIRKHRKHLKKTGNAGNS